MSTRRTARWALVLALLLPLCMRATIVNPPPFSSLVDQADYIVRAKVTAVASEWQTTDGNTHIITKVTLAVSEVLKGAPPSPLVL